MFEISEITSVANSRVKQLVRLRQHRERKASGQFIAEGTREISRALASGYQICSVYYCPVLLGMSDGQEDIPRQLKNFVPELVGCEDGGRLILYDVSESVFAKIAYRQNPQGVLAVFKQKDQTLNDLDEPCSGDLFLVAVGPTKPGNIGAMARSAAAAGCTGLLIADGVVDIYNPNAIRSSTGAVFSETVVGASGDSIRNFLKDRGVKMIAAAPPTPGDHASSVQSEQGMVYHEVDMTGPVAVVIGTEDEGLGIEWREFESERHGVCVSIPMFGDVVDSLNASTAATVLLFEVVRQRAVRT